MYLQFPNLLKFLLKVSNLILEKRKKNIYFKRQLILSKKKIKEILIKLGQIHKSLNKSSYKKSKQSYQANKEGFTIQQDIKDEQSYGTLITKLIQRLLKLDYILNQILIQQSSENSFDQNNQQQDEDDNQQYNDQDGDYNAQQNQYQGEEDGEDQQNNDYQNNEDQEDNNENNNGDDNGNNEENEDNQNQYNEEEYQKQNEFDDQNDESNNDDQNQSNNNNIKRYSNASNSGILDQQNNSYRASQFAGVNQATGSGNYNRNKDILDHFFKNYSGEVQNYFSEFKQKQIQDTEEDQENRDSNFYSKQNKGDISIVASDVPLVLRISFYYDNITFHPSEYDKDELFNKPNSYKSIMDSLQKFFYQRKNIRNFDPNKTKVTYNDFVEFSYFFIQDNDNLFLTQGGKEDLWVEQQENPLEKELKENIEKYENMLKKVKSPQEQQIIQNTIDNLKAQLALLQNKHGDKNKAGKNKAQMTKEQKRLRNLKEAYHFYSKQQNVTGVAFTFDRIVHEQNILNLACFQLFLKQFGVLNKNKYVTKREIQIMFKKYALNYKELDLDHFKIMIEKVAQAYYKDEENLTNIDKVEKFYQFIEIDDLDRFRARFTLLNQPFSIQVKDGFRLLPFDQGRDIILKKVSPQVREKIKERKEIKKLQSIQMLQPMDQIEARKFPKSTENRRSSSHLYKDSLGIQSSSVLPGGAISYANKKILNQQGKQEQAGKQFYIQNYQL